MCRRINYGRCQKKLLHQLSAKKLENENESKEYFDDKKQTICRKNTNSSRRWMLKCNSTDMGDMTMYCKKSIKTQYDDT